MKQKFITLFIAIIMANTCLLAESRIVAYSTNCVETPAPPAIATTNRGGFSSTDAWTMEYANCFKTSSSNGYYQLSFESGLPIHWLVNPKLKICWGASSGNRPLKISVNEKDTIQIDYVASSEVKKVKEIETAINVDTIYSLKLFSAGSSGAMFFYVEIFGEPNISFALINGESLAEGEQTTSSYNIKGYVAKIVNNSFADFQDMTFWVSDTANHAASNEEGAFLVQRGKTDVELSVGDIVNVETPILKHNGTIKSVVGANVTRIAEAVFRLMLSYNSEQGKIVGDEGLYKNRSEHTLKVSANYGYHFTQWSDGNTDNPRTIVLTQDTTFTAEFAKNTYTISTESANSEWGTTAGDKSALYLDKVEISATANYGYHFVKWNDNNTANPRTVSVIEDKTYTATFAKNTYSITKIANSEQGSISGVSKAEYLDNVTLTATPNYGYHFTQWSDGNTDNPRTIVLTQDTTFTAEYAYDRVGTCGKDLALVWSYDPNAKVLTIDNAGEFTENMQFGAEAPGEMEELVIGNSVTAIGENAFAGISTLKKVTIGESVKTIYDRAFFNCVNLETIFNYRPTPTNAYSTAFDGVDKFACVLYVLPSSIDMYKAAAVWQNFYYTYAIGAEEATLLTNEVNIEPLDNAAIVTWPTSDNAATYTLQITKDGVVFCTLIFNGNGQLTGIAFAPGKNGNRHAPAAKMTANGLQFTVTGLNSATHYNYTLQTKDASDNILASYSGEFTTTSEGTATGVDNVPSDQVQSTKIFRNGQIFILRGEKVYNAQGALVK
jgi:hypothetical protein